MDAVRHNEFDQTLKIFTKNFQNLTSYYYFKDVFSIEEAAVIIKTFDTPEMTRGTIFTGDVISNDRVSSVNWIPYNRTTEWIYDRILKHARVANGAMFKFDISNLYDRIQFTKYTGAEHGKYKRHMDIGENNIHGCRKLSISVQLSDPCQYEGGDLVIRNYDPVPKEMGTMCVFPSFLEHEVKPVTFGTRYSLVLWLYGPQFR